jgi:hypothetical protein
MIYVRKQCSESLLTFSIVAEKFPMNAKILALFGLGEKNALNGVPQFIFLSIMKLTIGSVRVVQRRSRSAILQKGIQETSFSSQFTSIKCSVT